MLWYPSLRSILDLNGYLAMVLIMLDWSGMLGRLVHQQVARKAGFQPITRNPDGKFYCPTCGHTELYPKSIFTHITTRHGPLTLAVTLSNRRKAGGIDIWEAVYDITRKPRKRGCR